MKNENNIDSYFEQVKQNPPLIPIEKVHQIINSPKAKARLKGKNINLLKFTIMTTIFAVIISAVLLWPGEKTKESSIRYQVSRQVSDERPVDEVSNDLEKNNSIPEKESKGDENKYITLAELKNGNSENETNSSTALNKEQISQSNVVPAPQNKEQSIDFDPATIQPTDGSRFVLKLTDEELEKIGFEVTDSSYAFNRQIGTTVFRYAFQINRRKAYTYDSVGNIIPYENAPIITYGCTENAFYGYEGAPKLENNEYDCQPIFKTNPFYSEIDNIEGVKKEDFNMVNDTLLPIILPVSKLYPDNQDRLIWFTTSEKLYAVLAPKHKEVVDEFRKYKAAKKAFPSKDLIVYQPPKLFDESKVVVLSKQELTKLGFKFYADSTTYAGNTRTVAVRYCKRDFSSSTNSSNGLSLTDYNNLLAVMITRTDGSPLAKFKDALETDGLKNQEYGSQFPLLIPILLKSNESFFKEDVIFWFNPTDELFNALPTKIGKALRKEYNYVVAEDKSALVQPECKYFEECKNTLTVSNFKVYPNPANNQVSVSFILPETIEGRITLVDLSGRERQVLQPQTSFSKGSHRIDVDISSVPEGIYLITLYSDKGIQTQRFIVNR